MPTIDDCLKQTTALAALCESPKRELQTLLCHCTGLSLASLYTWPEKTLNREQASQFEALLKRRINGEPMAYLTGQKDFWSLSLSVEQGVLVPRPETELLVELCLQHATAGSGSLLDLGTGTGAIALAFAQERPSWQITAVDKSEQCVALAKKNAVANRINNIHIQQSDWFSTITEQFDLLVSNPPYIDPKAPELQGDGVKFEPLNALIANDKGMADIRYIIDQAKAYLKPCGLLAIEHGYDQGEVTRGLFDKQGFSAVQTLQDYAGLDRVTWGRL